MQAMVKLFVWLVLLSLLVWVLAIIAGYALVVAGVGGGLALRETVARRQGRPYVEPGQRFLSVWSRAISPLDPKAWVTPQRRPATDPALLPGTVTGRLRVEPLGTECRRRPGPFDDLLVRMRLHNHGTAAVVLGDIDHVDLQLWTPEGTVVGVDPSWSHAALAPGQSCEVGVTVRVVDDVQVASWAICHRAGGGQYAFFPVG